MTAPYRPEVAQALVESIGHRCEVDVVDAAGASIAGVEAEDVRVRFDESTAPRVTGTLLAPVPDLDVVDDVDPRLGTRAIIRAGYVLPRGTEDVHTLADLGVRRRHIRRPANLLELTLQSDEALVMDAGAMAPATLSASSRPAAIRSLINAALSPDPLVTITHPDVVDTALDGITDAWQTIDDLANQIDADVYDTGMRAFVVEPRPHLAARSALTLRVGPRGTITDSDATLDRDEWANRVVIRYRWFDVAGVERRITGTATAQTGSPYAPDVVGLKVLPLERDTPTTQAAANAAAASVLRRMLSRSRSYTVRAVAAYWLRPGHTVTLQLPAGRQERHLVSAVEFEPLLGAMTVTTRLPDTATTIGE